ncbi:MAG: hydroxyacid dehydrogenase, partial [Gammaproteobacteria bacterium]|nr:hydroxyacid dehydrogenase [Gammaproteobacteria bacterium]
MREYDAVLYEVFSEEEDAIRLAWPDAPFLLICRGTIQEEQHDAPPARVISIRTQSMIPEDWCPSLEAILTRSTGYDHLIPFRDKRIGLGYLPEYCARSVAEHAFLLWTALLKKLPAQMECFKSFNRSGITGSELLDKKILVIGVGRIGVQIARLAMATG